MSVVAAPQQLTLPVGLRDDATFANFYGQQNVELLAHLAKMACGTGEQYLYFWGQAGVGRSHLLQAVCHQAVATMQTCFYLPLACKEVSNPQILEGLEQIQVVCIDDVDLIAGIPAWEEALFHFYNCIQITGNRLIVTAQHPAPHLNLQLADLVSRLNAGLSLHLPDLTDDEKLQALQLRAKARGINLSSAVGKYLLLHCSRSLAHLFQILQRLEEASLIAKHRLTIPFVKAVLSNAG